MSCLRFKWKFSFQSSKQVLQKSLLLLTLLVATVGILGKKLIRSSQAMPVKVDAGVHCDPGVIFFYRHCQGRQVHRLHVPLLRSIRAVSSLAVIGAVTGTRINCGVCGCCQTLRQAHICCVTYTDTVSGFRHRCEC